MDLVPDDGQAARAAGPWELVPHRALEARRAEWELRDRVGRLRTALGVGATIWPTFALLDVFVVVALSPGQWAWFLGLRASGWVVILIGYLWLRWRPDMGTTELGCVDLCVFTSSAVHISLMGVEFGGVTTPYAAGLVLVALVRSAAMADPWRVSWLRYLAIWLAFPLTNLAVATVDDRIARQLTDSNALALFFVYNFILFGTFFMGTLAEESVSRLRSRAYEAQQLGRYQLRRCIGRGATGEVWEAYHPGLRRCVALKILRPIRAMSGLSIARFEREVQVISSLAHPNTVRIMDHGHTVDGVWFYAMELLDGLGLDRVLDEEERLSPVRAMRLVRQTCDALDEAHRLQIVHRDIKPANLFVVAAGQPHEFIKVLDFGVAKLGADSGEATLTRDGAIAGTPAYLAPEVWRGDSAQPAADVYSLGCVLYELLFGTPPFGRGTSMELLDRHLSWPVAMPDVAARPAVSQALQDVIRRCLDKDPSQRYEHANALGVALSLCPEASSNGISWGSRNTTDQPSMEPVAGPRA